MNIWPVEGYLYFESNLIANELLSERRKAHLLFVGGYTIILSQVSIRITCKGSIQVIRNRTTKKISSEMTFNRPSSFLAIATKLTITPASKKITPISTIGSEYPSVNQLNPNNNIPKTIKPSETLLNVFTNSPLYNLSIMQRDYQ